MPDTIFYLSTCDTCKKILTETGAANYSFAMQDIKTDPVTEKQLELLKEKAGSYEALFSKRALLYKSLGLARMDLTEGDYKKYLHEHYTFLKRPVIIYKEELFIGSEKKTVDALKAVLTKK